MKKIIQISLAVAVWSTSSIAHAQVRFHSIFSDHAVLQQNAPIPVWGMGNADGAEVVVSLGDQTQVTRVQSGRWRVDFAPIKASEVPLKLKLQGLGTYVEREVWIGEVWIASGQSNMAWPLKETEGGKKAIANSQDSLLKWLNVPIQGSKTELIEVPLSWKSSSPAVSPYFSAVAYHFAREIRRTQRVPVGIIQNAVGASPIEAWISEKQYQTDPALKPGAEHYLGHPLFSKSFLHNAMVAPLMPYGVRGFLWYQGESNVVRNAEYFNLFANLIRGWREYFVVPAETAQQGSPFLFVQLASYMARSSVPEESDWAKLREVQRQISLTIPKAAMVVTSDLGDANDIHPRRKREVGERLSLAARKIAYGEKLEYSGPTLRGASVSGAYVTLEFGHADGLVLGRFPPTGGFALASDTGPFVWAKPVLYPGGRVVVSAPGLENPSRVRFGWANFVETDLRNSSGLPASPFQAILNR